MQIPHDAVLLRIFIGESDRWQHHPLYEATMTQNIWYVAAIWMGLALVASLISIRTGISVALIEIVVGVIVGNIYFGDGQHILKTTEWINFLAMLGSGVLTFLAGAEIDPVSLRANIRASLAIGF